MNTGSLQVGKLVETRWLIANCTLLSAVNENTGTLMGPDDAWWEAVKWAGIDGDAVCLLVEVGDVMTSFRNKAGIVLDGTANERHSERPYLLLLVGERLLYAYKTPPAKGQGQ